MRCVRLRFLNVGLRQAAQIRHGVRLQRRWHTLAEVQAQGLGSVQPYSALAAGFQARVRPSRSCTVMASSASRTTDRQAASSFALRQGQGVLRALDLG